MSKKPWIWPACRSSVRTRSAPATVIRLATSLAEIGVRGPELAVLPGIAEIGHDRGDPPRRGAPQRIEHDQQLHQVVVGRIGGRLDDERRPRRGRSRGSRRTPPCRRSGGRWHRSAAWPRIGRDRLGQRPVAVAGEDFHQSARVSQGQSRAEPISRAGRRQRRGSPTGRAGLSRLEQRAIPGASFGRTMGRRARRQRCWLSTSSLMSAIPGHDAATDNCSDFRTRAEAQAIYQACGGLRNDVHHLDADLAKNGSWSRLANRRPQSAP